MDSAQSAPTPQEERNSGRAMPSLSASSLGMPSDRGGLAGTRARASIVLVLAACGGGGGAVRVCACVGMLGIGDGGGGGGGIRRGGGCPGEASHAKGVCVLGLAARSPPKQTSPKLQALRKQFGLAVHRWHCTAHARTCNAATPASVLWTNESQIGSLTENNHEKM